MPVAAETCGIGVHIVVGISRRRVLGLLDAHAVPVCVRARRAHAHDSLHAGGHARANAGARGGRRALHFDGRFQPQAARGELPPLHRGRAARAVDYRAAPRRTERSGANCVCVCVLLFAAGSPSSSVFNCISFVFVAGGFENESAFLSRQTLCTFPLRALREFLVDGRGGAQAQSWCGQRYSRAHAGSVSSFSGAFECVLPTGPMRSAYKVANGSEPPFTTIALNHAGDEAFVETLDYVFVSPQWQVLVLFFFATHHCHCHESMPLVPALGRGR
jgi:hypothetical protein